VYSTFSNVSMLYPGCKRGLVWIVEDELHMMRQKDANAYFVYEIERGKHFFHDRKICCSRKQRRGARVSFCFSPFYP